MFYTIADIYVADNIWVPAGTPVNVEESPLAGHVTVCVTCNDKPIRVATLADKVVLMPSAIDETSDL